MLDHQSIHTCCRGGAKNSSASPLGCASDSWKQTGRWGLQSLQMMAGDSPQLTSTVLLAHMAPCAMNTSPLPGLGFSRKPVVSSAPATSARETLLISSSLFLFCVPLAQLCLPIWDLAQLLCFYPLPHLTGPLEVIYWLELNSQLRQGTGLNGQATRAAST